MDKETSELLGKILYTTGIVTGFWKFVDAFFSYMHKRQRGFVADVAREEIKAEIQPLKHSIAEIKELRERDNEKINAKLDRLIDQIGKK